MMRPTNENSLGEVIREMMKKYQLEDGLWSARIVDAWGKSMLPAVVQRTNSLQFKNGQLVVHLNSAVLKNELNHIKQDLMDQLNAELGEVVVLEMLIY